MKIYTKKEFIHPGKTIYVGKYSTSRTEPPHGHEFIELVYILSGQVTHEIDGQQYLLQRGDILFMSPGCTHAFYSNEKYTYINLLFSPEVLEESENPLPLLSLSAFNELRHDAAFGMLSFFGEERSEIEASILSMLMEFKEKKPHWEEILSNGLHTLLLKMLRKAEQGIEERELSAMWQGLSQYIDENLGSRLTLSALAEKCFYNPSYFSRCFKEKFGLTLTEYITKKRLNHAKELLAAGSLSIEEISEQCGFADRAACTKAFQKYLGANPKDFRKK